MGNPESLKPLYPEGFQLTPLEEGIERTVPFYRDVLARADERSGWIDG